MEWRDVGPGLWLCELPAIPLALLCSALPTSRSATLCLCPCLPASRRHNQLQKRTHSEVQSTEMKITRNFGIMMTSKLWIVIWGRGMGLFRNKTSFLFFLNLHFSDRPFEHSIDFFVQTFDSLRELPQVAETFQTELNTNFLSSKFRRESTALRKFESDYFHGFLTIGQNVWKENVFFLMNALRTSNTSTEYWRRFMSSFECELAITQVGKWLLHHSHPFSSFNFWLLYMHAC